MPAEEYPPLAICEFERLKRLGDRAIAQLSVDHFFARPGEGDNSVGVILKHLSGNLLSRWTDFYRQMERSRSGTGIRSSLFCPKIHARAYLLSGRKGGPLFFRRWVLCTPRILSGPSRFGASL